MKGLKLVITLVGILILILPLISWANEEKQKEEELVKLEEMVVTAMKEEAVVITPTKTVINVEKYAKPGATQTVRDILMDIGGIDIKRISIVPNPSEGITLRGLDESRFLVNVDGRPVNQWGAYGGYLMDWSTLPLDNVEKIEVIRGSHSALYPFSMGGTINIITKKGIKTKEIKPKITVESGVSEYGMETYAATVTGGFANFIGYSFSGARRIGDGYLRNNDLDWHYFTGRVTFFLPTEGKLTLGHSTNNFKMGYPVVNDPRRPDYKSHYPTVPDDMEILTHRPFSATYPGGINYWHRRMVYDDVILTQPIGEGVLNFNLYRNMGTRHDYQYSMRGGGIVSQVLVLSMNLWPVVFWNTGVSNWEKTIL